MGGVVVHAVTWFLNTKQVPAAKIHYQLKSKETMWWLTVYGKKRCAEFPTWRVTTSDVADSWQQVRCLISNVRYWRTDERLWTNWHMTWICHVEQRPVWLCSWDFIVCTWALSGDHKARRMAYAQLFLQHYSIHDQDFLKCTVAGYETWAYHRTSELKHASKEWKYPDSPWTRKFKVVSVIDNAMATVFVMRKMFFFGWFPGMWSNK